MAQTKKESRPKGWGGANTTLDEDLKSLKSWRASLTDEELESLLERGNREIKRVVARKTKQHRKSA